MSPANARLALQGWTRFVERVAHAANRPVAGDEPSDPTSANDRTLHAPGGAGSPAAPTSPRPSSQGKLVH